MLAAPAWRFVCYTETVGEGTDGKKPEPTGPEPLQAQESKLFGNCSNQPEPSGTGVNEQAEAANSAVKDEGTCSPPPPGKYVSSL